MAHVLDLQSMETPVGDTERGFGGSSLSIVCGPGGSSLSILLCS